MPDPARLLAEVSWLRALAARLVGRAELAEEVVQETLLAAIERRRGWESERGLRAWLGAVARNLARRAYGRERARAGVERTGARAEATESAEAALERVELHRLLVEAVLALEEPYRSAVIWRHLDGLAPEAIAARQGTSVETARQRVSRGLAKLRERLDARFEGGRTAWCALLVSGLRLAPGLPIGASASVVGAGSVLGGVAVASKAVWIGAGAALLAAIVWIAQEQSKPEEQPDLVTKQVDASTQEHAPAEQKALDPGQSERRRAPVVEIERVADPATNSGASLQGSVRDHDGRGIERVRVWVDSLTGADPEIGELETRADGSFAWELAANALAPDTAAGMELVAEHDSFLTARAPIAADVACTLVMQALPRVVGRLHADDGSPAKGPGMVWLEIEAPPSGEKIERDAHTEADGSFVVAALPLGRLVALRGRARGFAETRRALDQELAPDETHDLDLELDAGLSVRGVVVDAESRAPIPRATVYADRFQFADDAIEPLTIADDQGRFELSGVELEQLVESDVAPDQVFAMLELDARAEGYVSDPLHRTGVSVPEAGLHEVEGVEIALERAACRVVGRVRKSGGTSGASNQLVWIIDAHGNFHSASSDGDGRFEVLRLPEGNCSFFVRPLTDVPPDSPLPTVAGSSRVELVLGRVSEVEIVLEEADCVLAGRVLDPHGEPMTGVQVSFEAHFACESIAFAYQNRDVRTDEEGRYRIERLHLGPCSVKVDDPGDWASLGFEPESYELVLVNHELREDVDFRAWQAILVHGRIEAAEGYSGEYDVQLRDSSSGERRYRGDSSADGSFAFSRVRPGMYELIVQRNGRAVARTTIGPGSTLDLLLHPRD